MTTLKLEDIDDDEPNDSANEDEESEDENSEDEKIEDDDGTLTWITTKRVSCIDHSLVRSLTKVLVPAFSNAKYSVLIKHVKEIVKKVILACLFLI